MNIDVSPDMVLYKILQRQPYGEESALAEFIDNSLQSYLENQYLLEASGTFELKVKISFDTFKKSIQILDNAGGIKLETLQKVMKLGAKEQHSNDSLSVYGIGLKASAIWFSDNWSLESSALGDNQKFTLDFDLQSLLIKEDNIAEALLSQDDSNEHYTKITIHNHIRNDDIDFYKDKILPYLHEIFYKFTFLNLSFDIDGLTINPNSKMLFTHPNNTLSAKEYNNKNQIKDENSSPIKWEKDINFELNRKKVSGFIRIMNPGKYGQPGIRLFRNNRVIEGTTVAPNLPKKITGTKNKYGAQRIYGEIHLDEFIVNYQKTGFDEDLSAVYAQIENILTASPDLKSQASNYRVIPKPNPRSESPTDEIIEESDDNIDDEIINPNLATGTKDSNKINHNKILISNNIVTKLKRLRNTKLDTLYKSLCGISLKEHGVLSYVGAWAFLESLASYDGKYDGTSFESYYNNKINEFYTEKSKRNDLRIVIKDIHARGNSAKHSGKKAEVTGTQLRNDFEVLEEFLLDFINQL